MTEACASVCLLLATVLGLDWPKGLKLFACIWLYTLSVVLLVIASDVINVTLIITSEECTDGEYNQLWEKLSEMVANLFI